MLTPDETNSLQNSFMRSRVLKEYWQPPINNHSAFPFLIVLCLIFTILSFALLISNSLVFYKEIDYTDCTPDQSNNACAGLLGNSNSCGCLIEILLPNKPHPRYRIYYKIDNMYQNHRKYAESFDLYQQTGALPSSQTPPSCDKLNHIQGKHIIPCGYVPNSLFNDTFSFCIDQTPINIDKSKIITLPETKIFKNPSGNLSAVYADYHHPPNWHKYIYELDLNNDATNGFQNPDYINWMRIYPFPGVLKYLGELSITSELSNGKAIKVQIQNNYPVASFNGKKKLVVVQPSWIGIPNTNLGYIYCATSVISLLFVLCFWLSFHFSQPPISL
ncbi:hypothetical protein HZS_2871 [Henneguya salminicola]|nr:hypothetical protein HZS_2871 [Henneguya salminicola]